MRRPPADTPPLYAQDGLGHSAVVHAHYFVGGCDWFVTEYSAAEDIAFGWACLGDPANAELGYFSLAELAAVRADLTVDNRRLRGVLEVEYDEHWSPCVLFDAIDRLLSR